MAALPSALPEANGFVALVADAPVAVDPLERGAGQWMRLMRLMDPRWELLICWHVVEMEWKYHVMPDLADVDSGAIGVAFFFLHFQRWGSALQKQLS